MPIIPLLLNNADLSAELSRSYDPVLVSISLLISCLASFTAIEHSGRILTGETRVQKFTWWLVGSIVLGIGVWAMHFLGMLAFALPVPVSYGIKLTVISVLPAILASGLTLHMLTLPHLSITALCATGAVMTVGVALMHFVGMAAMRMDAMAYYSPLGLAAALAASCFLITTALSVERSTNTEVRSRRLSRHRMGAAVLFGAGISSLHYLAMAAGHFLPEICTIPEGSGFINTTYLSGAVAAVAFAIIILATLTGALRRRLESLARLEREIRERRQAEQALMDSELRFASVVELAGDAILLLDADRRIKFANAACARMFSCTAEELANRPLSELLPDLALNRRLPESQAQDAPSRFSWHGEATGHRADGSRFPADVSLSNRSTQSGIVTTAILRDITRRRAAERALREREAQLSAVIASSPGAVVIRDLDGRNLFVNDIFEEWYQVTREEIIGKTMYDYLPPAIFEEIAAQEKTVVTTMRTMEAERRVTFPDGKTRDVFSQKFPVFDESGACIAIGTIVNDISTTKKTETDLRESESRLQAVFDASPMGITVKDVQGRYLIVNRTFTEWVQTAAKDVIGKTPYDIHPRKDADAGMANDYKVFETGKIQVTESNRILGGKARSVITHKAPVRSPEGQIVATVTVITDVSELKSAEIALKKSEERFRAVVDNLPIGVNMKDLDGRFTLVNKIQAEWYGLPEEALLGRTAAEVLGETEEEQAGRAASERKLFESGQAVIREAEKMRLTGIRQYLVVNKFPITDADGRVVSFGTASTDITDRKLAEEDREKALIEAERANHAKSQFLATMSHELRTPLNAILGFSEILTQQYFGPLGGTKYEEYAADIHSSAAHLLELVNDLLDISAIEVGKTMLTVQKLPAGDMIKECVQIVQATASVKSLKLRADLPENVSLDIAGDRRAVKQILLNLLSNAIKFTSTGGTITVRAEADATAVDIIVEDDGDGISPDHLDSLMQPFSKIEHDPYRAAEGWGLGLSISRSLIELQGGELKITSEPGKGTKVVVRLPNWDSRENAG